MADGVDEGSAAMRGSGMADATALALAQSIANYLQESSILRHGLFMPSEFKDLVAARILDYLNRQRACDSALSRTVSKPGAALEVKAVPIPPRIQAAMAQAIKEVSDGPVWVITE